jgi:hypothetical protein
VDALLGLVDSAVREGGDVGVQLREGARLPARPLAVCRANATAGAPK